MLLIVCPGKCIQLLGVFDDFVCSLVEQERHHLVMTTFGCLDQRRPATVTLGLVDIGAMFRQQCDDLQTVISSRLHQRTVAALVS